MTFAQYGKWLGSMVVALSIAASPAAAADEEAGAESKPLPDLHSVLGDLRKGGFDLYYRHTSTDQSTAGDADADLRRCETQRNLSAEGRAEAARIGKAIKGLRIPVGSVLASPFCRTQDTARLAFGRVAVSEDLYFALGADETEMTRLRDALRRMLSTPPAPGTNVVLVSHSANLREAAGIFAKPEGVAYIFRPLPNGKFEAVARVLPQDWSGVALPARTAAAR